MTVRMTSRPLRVSFTPGSHGAGCATAPRRRRDLRVGALSPSNYSSQHALQRTPYAGGRGSVERRPRCPSRGSAQSLPFWRSLQPWSGYSQDSGAAAYSGAPPLSQESPGRQTPSDFPSGFRARRSLSDGMKGVAFLLGRTPPRPRKRLFQGGGSGGRRDACGARRLTAWRGAGPGPESWRPLLERGLRHGYLYRLL